MSHTPERPTKTIVDLDALAANFLASKDYIGRDIRYMAVVKADAYGHGAVACARRLEAEGVDWFGIAIPEEGVELRDAGITAPILCLGLFWAGQEELIVENRLTPVIFDEAEALRLNEFAGRRDETLDIHVKIDTGMGRLGSRFETVIDLAKTLKSLRNLKVNGLMTHFASAEAPEENDFTNKQIDRFEECRRAFAEAGHEPAWIDLANSPGAIRHPRSRPNLVRLGGALYGLIDDILPGTSDRPELRPVLSLVSKIAHLKRLPAGETLGYGRTFTTERESLIAAVPIGYADGYPRGLSNCGKAAINGQLAPVAGRVSMDWTLFDVTDIPDVKKDDDVFLIGGSGEAVVTAADIARCVGTIGYEITCGISPRVPRVYEGRR
jgi:alanine racemase